MTKKFVEEVKKKTDNNDYASGYNYYNTYLREPLWLDLKDSNKDFELHRVTRVFQIWSLFSDSARELGIEVEVIIFL